MRVQRMILGSKKTSYNKSHGHDAVIRNTPIMGYLCRMFILGKKSNSIAKVRVISYINKVMDTDQGPAGNALHAHRQGPCEY